MPDISDAMQPFTDSIYKVHENRPRRKSRRLGGSMIGEKCDRKIWYNFRHVKTVVFKGRTLRIFDTGHEQEERIIKELREAGHKVEYVGDDQIEFEWCNGHFVDKPDGIVNDKYSQDIKTMNDRSFKKTSKDGLSHKYNIQMLLHIEGAVRDGYIPTPGKGLFIAVNKNDESFFEKIIKRDSRVVKAVIERADRIINAPYPPGKLSEDPSFYECKFCDFWSLCHEGGSFEFSCRSCIFSDPVDGGRWHCSKYDKNIGPGYYKPEDQPSPAPQSCESYQQIENR